MAVIKIVVIKMAFIKMVKMAVGMASKWLVKMAGQNCRPKWPVKMVEFQLLLEIDHFCRDIPMIVKTVHFKYRPLFK